MEASGVPSITGLSRCLKTDASKMTISISGREYMISTILMMIISTTPPAYPDMEPTTIPITSTMILAKNPTARDILVPYTTRMK